MDYAAQPEPEGRAQPRRPRFPWVFTSLAALLVVAVAAFHWRWERPVAASPVVLPARAHAFARHPALLPFDAAARERWRALVGPRWWELAWVDAASGRPVVRGLDMFHKLHCLRAVRDDFTALILDDPARSRAIWAADDAASEAARLHLGHCFDFLRQGMLCAADATLEPLGPGYTEESGEGVVHQCKDWGVLMALAGLSDDWGAWELD